LREVLVPEPLVETVDAEVDDLTTMLKGNAVESEVGDHTEFTITLPRKMFAGDESRP